jgi:DNA-binding PadR family transcriptional regulator
MCARHDDFGFGAWTHFGPGFGHRGGRGRGRRGFRARPFDRGDLKYAILGLLREKPMHGYEIMQALEQESGGLYSPSPGSVYPALQLLQDQAYVRSEEQDGKRIYTITEEGLAFLERHSERVDDVMDRVSEFTERFTSGELGDVGRSFMKFAQASWEEAFRRMGDKPRMAELKEIIERATRDVRASAGRSQGGGEASHA